LLLLALALELLRLRAARVWLVSLLVALQVRLRRALRLRARSELAARGAREPLP
jgi:hypothetical protein